MKNVHSILIMFLSVMIGCGKNNQPANEISTVDVTAKYPYKELILQDFMDVEYIPLETTDEFLCMGSLWGVGKDVIVATNFNSDGNIFIFDPDIDAFLLFKRDCDFLGDAAILF